MRSSGQVHGGDSSFSPVPTGDASTSRARERSAVFAGASRRERSPRATSYVATLPSEGRESAPRIPRRRSENHLLTIYGGKSKRRPRRRLSRSPQDSRRGTFFRSTSERSSRDAPFTTALGFKRNGSCIIHRENIKDRPSFLFRHSLLLLDGELAAEKKTT